MDGPMNRVKRDQINGDNIYDSWNIKNNRRKSNAVANKRHLESYDAETTGIVPNYYNQRKFSQENVNRSKARRKLNRSSNNDNDSVFSDDGSNGNNKLEHMSQDSFTNDHVSLFRKSNLLSDNRVHERKFMRNNTDTTTGRPGFLSQFDQLEFNNPSDPVSSNAIPKISGPDGKTARLEMERDLALQGEYSKFVENNDMTYGVVDDKDFVHNNMMPFFKSGFGKGYGPDSVFQKKLDDTKQRINELYTGSSKSVDYRPKTERRPLFNPQVGNTWIYGMPNFTDYFETRHMPGRERRNEQLTQPVRITPGLDIGYNEVSKMGYQETWRPLPKTVDELRTATNPKISYGSVVIPGLKGNKGQIVPNVTKRSPEKFVENDPRDLLKSLSYYRAPSIYGNYDAPITNRQMTSKAWYGAAGAEPTLHKPGSMMEQASPSLRENFENTTIGPAAALEREKATTATANTYFLDPTNRQIHGKRTYVQPAGPAYAKDSQIPALSGIHMPTTLKQLIENNTYQQPASLYEGNKGGYIAEQSGTYAPVTLKQLIENNTYQQPAALNEGQKGGYEPEQSGIHLPATLRQLIQNNTYQQQPSLFEGQKGGYGPEQSGIHLPTTLRQLIQNTTQLPVPVQFEGQKGGYQAEQSGTFAPTTLRQLTQNTTYQQQPSLFEGQKGGYIAEQSGTVAPTTLRQLTQNTTYQQQPTPFEQQRGAYQTEQSGIHIPTNLRQLTQNTTYQQQPAPFEGEKGGYQAEQSGIHIPTTLKQLIQDNTYQQPAALYEGQKGGYVAEQAGTHAPTTLRQLTENRTYQQPSALYEGQKGGYQAEQSGVHMPATLRQLTENRTYQQPTALYEGQKGGYIAEQAGTHAPTTLRQLTQNRTYQQPSALHEGQKGGYIAEQAGTHAPTTLRQLTQEKTYQGPLTLHDGQKGGYIAEQSGTYAPTTLRQLTQDRTYQQPATLHDGMKGGYIAEQAGTIAPTTLRQLTQDKTYQGPLIRHDATKGGYEAAQKGTIAKPTMRQMTENKTYQGPLIRHDATKTRSRADAYNMLVNVARDEDNIVRDGGAPVTSNYEQIPTYEHTMVTLKEPIQVNREVYGDMHGQRPLQCIPTMQTRYPSDYPSLGWRFDTCVAKQLASNPLVNNTIHKSVEY